MQEIKSSNLTDDIEPQYIISANKFVVLSFITFGLYTVWWFYKAWRFFKQINNSSLHPALRTIFGIFFFIPLTSMIIDLAKRKSYQKNYSPTLLFIAYLITISLSYLPSLLGLLSVFAFVFLIEPFKALNFAKINSTGYEVIEQNSFNGRQIFLLIIGSLWWLLVLISLFILLTTAPEYPNYYE